MIRDEMYNAVVVVVDFWHFGTCRDIDSTLSATL